MRFLFLFTSLIYSIVSSAQVIDRSIVVNNINKVTQDYAFLDGDVLSFRIKRNSVEKCSLNWELSIELKDNSFIPLIQEDIVNDSFSFTITPELFKQDNLKYRRIETNDNSSIYYHAVIVLHNNNAVVDTMSISINVLPSIPRIVSASLEGVFEYEQCSYNDQAELFASFTAHSMDKCYLAFIQSRDSLFLQTYPKDYMITYIPIDFVGDDNGYSIKYGASDWGQYYKIMALNNYGCVFSMDAIHTTKLINDPNIISAIEQSYQSTNIKNLSPDSANHIISCKDNKIFLNTSFGVRTPIKIFSLEGRLVLSDTITDFIDISFLPKGVYFVKVLFSMGKYVSCKIIKI